MKSPKIEAYEFGQIVVDGRRYTQDLILLPDRVVPNWWRKEGHSLALEDLQEVLESPPDLLVVGQGHVGRMQVPARTRQRLEEAGMEVIAEPTTRACETYNRLRRERRVAAALHLTC